MKRVSGLKSTTEMGFTSGDVAEVTHFETLVSIQPIGSKNF